MSLDSKALLDITSAGVTPERLRDWLVGAPDFALALIARYREHWKPKQWVIEPAPVTNELEILGPGGFALHIRARTLSIYHMMRFSAFSGDAWHRAALRAACFSLAGYCGSASAIYTHELMPIEGEDLRDIESSLRSRVGVPASTFEELHAAEDFGPGSWFIDTFDDLRSK